MRKRNSWIQKKSVVVIIAVLLLIAILAVAAELGMKSGSRPLGMIEKIKNGNKDNNESNSDSDLDSDNMEGEDGERKSKNDSDSELNTGYGYEMDVFSDKNNSTEKKTVYEKGYDLPVDEQENKTAKEELHEMMQAVWPIYDKSEKGDTSNVVLPNKSVKKILDKIESCSVPAFFSGREEHMCNADKFDAFLKKAQKGEKDSIVVYEVHEDGGIGRNKYIFDGQNMYVLYVGSVWNDDKYPYGKPQTDEVARGSGNREYGCRRLREKLPNFSGVSFFRAGNSSNRVNAFHICVYVHRCAVPRYIALQHP